MAPRILFTLLVSLFFQAGAFAGLEFGKPLWGFDGTATKNAFNLLSIEVRNSGGAAFDGTVSLDSDRSGRSSAPYTTPVFLAPGTSRWVQFYPYFGNYVANSGWSLKWSDAKGGDSKTLDSETGERLQGGAPAVVILVSLSDPTLRGARMPVFDEALFPPTVAATDGLHAIILDHQPRFDPARRAAFLDWLHGGGIVHLVPGPDGVFPEFTDDFAPLNFPGEKTKVGSGTVAKHTATRAEITPKHLADAGYPAPASRDSDNSNSWRSEEETFFQPLASLTRPDINWPLIYLLTLVYVGLVGPAFYILRKRDYRLLLGGFVVTVAGFAWLFTVIGRRGYGEKQIYHSVGIAHALGHERWDVRHWTHPFATTGDSYRLAYPGGGQLYAATSSRGEAIRGEVIHGKDSAFVADIPLFSSQRFLHRGAMAGPDLGLAITTIKPKPKNPRLLDALTLSVGPAFPATFIKAAAVYRKNAYSFTLAGSTLTARQKQQGDIRQALGNGNNDPDIGAYSYRYGNMDVAQARQSLREMGAALALAENTDATADLGPDTLRIFIYAEAPKAFSLANDQFQAGTDYILYIQDLPVDLAAKN